MADKVSGEPEAINDLRTPSPATAPSTALAPGTAVAPSAPNATTFRGSSFFLGAYHGIPLYAHQMSNFPYPVERRPAGTEQIAGGHAFFQLNNPVNAPHPFHNYPAFNPTVMNYLFVPPVPVYPNYLACSPIQTSYLPGALTPISFPLGPLVHPVRFSTLPAQNTPAEFTPMRSVIDGRAPHGISAMEKIAYGFSPNYLGDINNTDNYSANIPANESTNLYIMGLDNNVTEKILDHLCKGAPFGKVHFTFVTPGGLRYPKGAAKLSMFTREAAEKVYNYIASGKLVIWGQRARVMWNKQRVAPVQVEGREFHSRVLLIKGPPSIVNVENLHGYLKSKLFFRTHEVEVVYETPEKNLIIWMFASYRVQTTTARLALVRMWPQLNVRYGRDPMDVGVKEARRVNSAIGARK